ncbi:unnamed protein product [Prorocentrum cordatum]|uniref:Uncharacterized protein n=1 Tax=Prorocentrum cordatum TaxID=2364126 RepID=A0ABN9URY9_9DINO|nr:unnamed protein product [Polarella glacialis]
MPGASLEAAWRHRLAMFHVWRRARCPCAGRGAAHRDDEKEPVALLSCRAQVSILLSGVLSCLVVIRVAGSVEGSAPGVWLFSRQGRDEPPRQLLNPVLYMNDYRPEDYAISGSDLRRAMEVSAGNVGNLIWMHGGWSLLQEPSAHEFIYSSLDDPRLPTFNTKGFYPFSGCEHIRESLCVRTAWGCRQEADDRPHYDGDQVCERPHFAARRWQSRFLSARHFG